MPNSPQDGRVELQPAPVISIVDDDESVRVATRSLVRSLGLTAYTFESAEAFLKSGHVDATSFIISDVRMPSMNGIELQEHLIARGRHIPIIFMTAFPDPGVEARAKSVGAIAVLTKPFDAGVLLGCIETALKRPRHS